jgi:hypothetical protein
LDDYDKQALTLIERALFCAATGEIFTGDEDGCGPVPAFHAPSHD